MIPPSSLLAIRALAALLLAITGLQAVPVRAVDLDRHHGSAFDIASIEVSTAPALRRTSGDTFQQADPLTPPPLPAVVPVAVPVGQGVAPAALVVAFPRIGWSLAREIASLALAPRPPPLA